MSEHPERIEAKPFRLVIEPGEDVAARVTTACKLRMQEELGMSAEEVDAAWTGIEWVTDA